MKRDGNRAIALRVCVVFVVMTVFLALFQGISTEGDGTDLHTDASFNMETPEMIDGELWIHQDSRDFSEDPGWITNNPSHYYWDSSSETYYIEWEGGSGEYAYAPVTMKDNVSRIRVEYDIEPTQLAQDSDLPVGLFETDMEYKTSNSIQFFLSRNSTTNFTAVETFDSTGAYNGSYKDLGFQVNTWYHVVMVVDHLDETVNIVVSKTGTTTELYNLSIGEIGTFGDLPKVGVSTVGVSGGTAKGYIDNFTASYSYEGPGSIDVALSKDRYRPGESVDIEAGYYQEVDQWVQLSDAPVKRKHFASAWNDEERFLIVFGGERESYSTIYDPRPETFIYYAENDTWVQMGDAPIKRCFLMAVWHPTAKRMIVHGGWDSTGSGVHQQKDTWEYDPYNDTWKQLKDGNQIRDDGFMVYNPVNDTILVGGGYATSGGFLSDHWEYNYTNDDWTRLKSLPKAVVSQAAVWDTYGDRMLVFGGEDSGNNNLNITWAYYRNNDTWISLRSGFTGRTWMKAVWDPVNYEMYITGGYGGRKPNLYEVRELAVYNSKDDTWTNLGNSTIPRRTVHCAQWDTTSSSILIYGGTNTGETVSLNDTWRFGPEAYYLPGRDLAIEVQRPDNSTFLLWTNATNTSGRTTFEFALPKDVPLGLYNCTMTSPKGDIATFNFTVANDTIMMEFHIKSVTITGSFGSGGHVNATVVLENTYDTTRDGRLTLSVLDPKRTVMPYRDTNVTISGYSELVIILRIDLPAETRTGTYEFQVNLLTDYPHVGGTKIDHEAGTFPV